VSLIRADARALPLRENCVQCVVTSPPYFGLRDYGVSGQIGLEPTPDAYVSALVAVFRCVWRVLKDDGVCWLNLGDSYFNANPGSGGDGTTSGLRKDVRDDDSRIRSAKLSISHQRFDTTAARRVVHAGLKPKDLCGIPWRVAFALQAAGWYLRSDVIWSKPNPMPESVQGSHYSRHQVTIDEYERLSGLRYVCECAGDDWAGDMPDMSERESVSGKAPLSAERQGEVYGASARGTCGCASQAAGVLCVTTRAVEQREVSADAEGASDRPETVSQLPSSPTERRGRVNGAGLADDTGPAQAPLLLLPQEEDPSHDGSCDSTKQGRSQLSREHRPGVSVVQLRQEGQDDSPVLVGCPGCHKCIAHHGYIFHLSAGRPTKAHEYVFLLTKSERYYWDADAVKEPITSEHSIRRAASTPRYVGNKRNPAVASDLVNREYRVESGRNVRSVWSIATQSYSGAHFATMPEKLVERCVLAGSRPGDLVLDPFMGSGTVGRVALSLGRRAVGCDLNREYLALADERLTVTRGLPLEVA
jgi:DNA modification methylase